MNCLGIIGTDFNDEDIDEIVNDVWYVLPRVYDEFTIDGLSLNSNSLSKIVIKWAHLNKLTNIK